MKGRKRQAVFSPLHCHLTVNASTLLVAPYCVVDTVGDSYLSELAQHFPKRIFSF